MNYTQREVRHDLVRAEVLSYLLENRDKFIFSGLQEDAIARGDGLAASKWQEHVSQVGMSLPEFVDDVYERLHKSGKVICTPKPVSDSIVANTCDTYYATRITYLILDEIVDLVRCGVLVELKFSTPARSTGSLDFKLQSGRLMLTEYGYQFVADPLIVPYFAEEYLDLLRRTQEPDDVLQGYLSEGLACLRHRLNRAAAVLLRLAAEHTLQLLIDSTIAALGNRPKEQAKLEGKIKSAGLRIQDRAEAIFRKLESAADLAPAAADIRNRLRAAFHSVRRLGGRAAHLSETIRSNEIRDHYSLFASSIYSIVMGIIKHQEALV